MILSGDKVGMGAMAGLLAMEEMKVHLRLKEKELELIGLERLLSGDKGAMKQMHTMTPDLMEKFKKWWNGQNTLEKGRSVFFFSFFIFIVVLWQFRKSVRQVSFAICATRIPLPDVLAFVIDSKLDVF